MSTPTKRERERERERGRERETDRQSQTETERETDRDREREREIDRETERGLYAHLLRQGDIYRSRRRGEMYTADLGATKDGASVSDHFLSDRSRSGLCIRA